jgi:hypothetical protein
MSQRRITSETQLKQKSPYYTNNKQKGRQETKNRPGNRRQENQNPGSERKKNLGINSGAKLIETAYDEDCTAEEAAPWRGAAR